jgi:hypothetical protein
LPSVSSDCAAYFGSGGSRTPSGALLPFPAALNATPALRSSCLLARRTVVALAPGASATFAFVWSYITPRAAAAGLDAQELAAKYAVAAIDGSLRSATTAAFLSQVRPDVRPALKMLGWIACNIIYYLCFIEFLPSWLCFLCPMRRATGFPFRAPLPARGSNARSSGTATMPTQLSHTTIFLTKQSSTRALNTATAMACRQLRETRCSTSCRSYTRARMQPSP